MTLALRGVGRAVALLALVVLCVVALAVAVFSIEGDRRALSLASLAGDLRLFSARAWIEHLLGRLEAPGGIAWRTAAGALLAMLIGPVLLIAALVPRRRRTTLIGMSDSGGELRADPATLQALAAAAVSTDRTAGAKRPLPRRVRRLPGSLP